MKNIVIITLVSLGFISCSSDLDKEPQIVEPYTLTIESYIDSKYMGKQMPDINADVFVYYGFYTMDLLGYDLHEDGYFFKEAKDTIFPQIYEKISNEGIVKIQRDTIVPKISVLIRSNLLNGKSTGTSFTNSRKEIKFCNYWIID